MKKRTLITAILLTANLLFAQIINIPDDYPTIQQGINVAGNGDTVMVQPGTYFENVEIFNKSLILASLYLTTQDTSYISQTIIDGGQEGSVISVGLGEQGDIEISVAGFTIQNGTANNSVGLLAEKAGGGVCINWVNINPEPNNIKLSNLIIRDNFAWDKGGGVYIGCDDWGFGIDSTSNVYIKDVFIRDNSSFLGSGGGIYCENINPVLENVVIEENNIGIGGAGHGGYFYQTKPRFQNVRVISNPGLWKMKKPHVKSIKGPLSEKALVFDHSSPLLQNVLIADNNLSGLCLMNSEAVIQNSTFTYDCQTAILCDDSSSVILINSIIWGNDYSSSTPIQMVLSNSSPCSVSYCDIQDGINGVYGVPDSLQWLDGNISDDPLFEDTGDSTYQLSSASPCIDAGTPDTAGLNLPCWDLLGNKRIWDGDGNGTAIVDMGAYEFGAIPVGMEKLNVQSSKLKVRNYPNPVSDNFTIEFELAKPARVSIQIYNNIGYLLIEPRNQIYSTGQHQVNLNLIDLNDGIYFCRVQIGNEMVTKKIMKL